MKPSSVGELASWVGKVVRPRYSGSEVDWRKLTGRVVDVWVSPGAMGEPVGEVVWFNGPHKRTTGYPLDMLEVVR